MIETNAAGKIMFARRAAFAGLFAVTMAGSLYLAALALSPGGLGFFDIVALALFAFTLPWMVAGFCNALIGFVIMRSSADPVATVVPAVGRVCHDDPVTASTAILLCVRNDCRCGRSAISSQCSKVSARRDTQNVSTSIS
jgi:membrane glycosyltransferase